MLQSDHGEPAGGAVTAQQIMNGRRERLGQEEGKQRDREGAGGEAGAAS